MELFIIGVSFIHVCISFYKLEYGLSSLLCIKILIPDVARSIIPSLSLNAFCSIVLGIALICSFFMNSQVRKSILKDKMVIFGILFYLSNYFFLFLSTVPFSYQIKLMHTFFILQILPIMCASVIIDNKNKLLLIIKVIGACFFISATYGIIAWINNDYWYNKLFFNYYGEYFGRNTDMTTAAAAVMAGLQGRIVGTAAADSYGYGMIVPVLFMLFYSLSYKLKSRSLNILVILLGINVLLTVRRTPIITCLVFFMCLFLFQPLKLKIRYFKIFIIVFLIGILCIHFIPALESFKNILEASLFFWSDSVSVENEVSGSSVSLREYQLLYTLNEVKNNVFWGNGWGSMYYDPHPTMFGWESIVFTTLMQFGFLGSILWIFMFFFMYRYSIFGQQNIAFQRSFIIGAIALCVFTDSIYLAYTFLGCLLMGKLYLLNDSDEFK